MIVGIDIDDTITRHPAFFSFLSRALLAAGYDVYIISFRENLQDAEATLQALGVVYTQVILPTERELHDGMYGWKAGVCKRLGVGVLFDDMPEVINELDDTVLGLVPFDPQLGRLTYVDDETYADLTEY